MIYTCQTRIPHELHVKKGVRQGGVNLVQTLDLSQNRISTFSVSYWFSVQKVRKCVFYGFTMQCFFFYFSMYVFPCITFLKFVYDTFLPIPYHTKLVFEHSTICQYSTFIRVLYILCIHLQHSHLQSCSRVQDLGYTPVQYSYTILS